MIGTQDQNKILFTLKSVGCSEAIAIASRESHVGSVLIKGWGDSHHAFGICQVDCRANKIEGMPDPASEDHLNQAASILSSFFWKMKKKHPTWTEAQQLKGAVASYNVGPGNVDTVEHMDVGTTEDDYSSDVWSRAQYYAA